MDILEKRKRLLILKKDIRDLKSLNLQRKIGFQTFVINNIMIEKKIKELEEGINVKRF